MLFPENGGGYGIYLYRHMCYIFCYLYDKSSCLNDAHHNKLVYLIYFVQDNHLVKVHKVVHYVQEFEFVVVPNNDADC